MPEVHVLRAQDFQFGPLVTRAVAAESDDQEDHEPDDDMDDIDVEWPPNPNNSIDEDTLPTAQGAYTAKVESKQEKYGSKKRRTLAELIGLGFQVIPWNGIDARPLVDSTGRISRCWLANRPRTNILRPLSIQGTASHFPAAMCRHRRGLFAAINIGFGLWQRADGSNLAGHKQYASLAERLLSNEDITRMANFASVFGRPRLYRYYVHYNTRLGTDLRRPFPKSVFASVAFNFGSNVWTFKHRDVCNLPYGWCSYPPSLSATIAHSNIPVQDGEERPAIRGGSTEEFARLMKLRESRGRTVWLYQYLR
ncbi:hypothetical protein DFH07DRAFT_1021423 [Mycena maculata]|uniref:Uncharacterized protein n=1 Tax=Mycena maculata TaxID=230809 RepID=A0AAD7JBC8_9AGAR|nr:hypothetical protein DFH07DRAFT_1021423 [Mycena maculata]